MQSIGDQLRKLTELPAARLSGSRRLLLLLTFALCLALAVQLVRLGAAYQAVRSLDPQIEVLVEGKDTGEKEGGKGESKLPEISQNIFHRSQVSYNFSGMLGDAAIVNGSLVKVGDRVDSATVEEIGRNVVKIRTDAGEVRELKAFYSIDMEAQPPGRKEQGEKDAKPQDRRWSPAVDALRRLTGE